MKTDIDKNLDRKGNSKGFHKGSEPTEYGPDSVAGGNPAYKNSVAAVPDPNTDKGKTYDKRMITPRDPVLNAVPMPNKKGKEVNYGVLDVKSEHVMFSTAPNGTEVGGTPMPNTIK